MTSDVTLEYECMDCGYGYVGRKLPRRCPECGAEESWEKIEYDDWDNNGSDQD